MPRRMFRVHNSTSPDRGVRPRSTRYSVRTYSGGSNACARARDGTLASHKAPRSRTDLQTFMGRSFLVRPDTTRTEALRPGRQSYNGSFQGNKPDGVYVSRET